MARKQPPYRVITLVLEEDDEKLLSEIRDERGYGNRGFTLPIRYLLREYRTCRDNEQPKAKKPKAS